MPTSKGPYSADDAECNTGVGLDRDSYNPGPLPNKYVANRKGDLSIDLSKTLDRPRYDDIGEEGVGFNKPGYSGKLSRFKNHP
jgi:hypothetical protein